MGLAAGLLGIIVGFIELVVGLRVVLVFFNVMTDRAPLVGRIYDWSMPFVHPFTVLVPTYALGSFTLDLPAIIALLVYALVGGALIRLLRRA